MLKINNTTAQYLKISKIIEIFLYFKFNLNLNDWKLGYPLRKNMLYNIVIKHKLIEKHSENKKITTSKPHYKVVCDEHFLNAKLAEF